MKAIPLLSCLILVALAQPAPAEGPVPKPKLRPGPDAAREAEAPPGEMPPIPRLRPRQGAEATGPGKAPEEETPAETKKPSETEEPPEEERAGWPAAAVAEARQACGKLLEGREIDYQALGPLGGEGSCGAPAPVSVSRVAGVAISPPATLTCDMAAALHDWIAQTVQPAARRRLGTEVTEVSAGTSYACRRRNNSSSGKLSEHGRANALDMAGFSFAKRTDVAVGGSGSWGEGLLGAIGISKNGSFLEDIRKGACAHFTTVLGPGSDPYHGDHFHVDVLRRKGDYRICQ
ncbi:extensin family protein [Aestuariivirga sp.]|uniref:extensin-like domain-containing protein n=1 Tax=Aestuariivirga sp. TaxID=2650926 RepID=UPI00391CBCE4